MQFGDLCSGHASYRETCENEWVPCSLELTGAMFKGYDGEHWRVEFRGVTYIILQGNDTEFADLFAQLPATPAPTVANKVWDAISKLRGRK